MRILAAALVLSSLAVTAAAEPVELLKPMAFLAGHCWKGTFADGKATDEHCFAWLYDGRALRDTHTVRVPGRPDALGETTYYVDLANRRVEFLYIENGGGVSRGTVEAPTDALLFPATQYVSGGGTLVYRARWTPQGPGAYEAWSEAQAPDGWKTMFRLVLQRSD
jgi:hypothetical protein